MSNPEKPSPESRRLTLMPEVLPAPHTVPSGSVRRRTLNHLQRVMVTAAAAGALAAACASPPQTKTSGEPTTPPDDGDPQDGEHGYIDPDPNRGYVVVDMLPPPALCSGVASLTPIRANWQRDGRTWHVRLEIEKPPFGELSQSQRPVSMNGEIISAEPIANGGVAIRWRPEREPQGAGSIMVPATAHGVAQFIAVDFLIRPASERLDNEPIQVTVYDTCR